MPSYVVTGASRGLGYAYIQKLASDPKNTVIGIVRNEAATKARLAKDKVTNVHLFSADVTDIKAVQAAATATAAVTGGTLDVLIHNAALISEVSRFTSLLDHEPAELEADLLDSFRANVVGSAHVINAFLPLIRAGGLKKVIVISSGMGDPVFTNDFHVPNSAPYSISKAAANMLVSKYHATLGKSEGVVFLALSPGLVDTSEGNAADAAQKEYFRSNAAAFKDYAPHFKGALSPEESVDMTLDVIGKATVETAGGDFLSHSGNKVWL